MELKFKVDTKHRKDWFTGVSFSHPAKMALPLQLWIIENYTKAGETILDPMSGSGTLLVACSLGRNVIAVELEQKFIDIMKGNWEKIKQRGAQLGYTFGNCQIIQGDARQLEGLLVDKIITSPPYEEAMGKKHHSPRADKLAQEKSNPTTYTEVDAILTSPPYEGSVSASTGGERDQSSARQREKRLKDKGYNPAEYQGGVGRNLEVDFQYSKDDDNIGNLKSGSYLQAMLQVYQSCWDVLKDGGLLILVTKNFIRNKTVIRLDTDTIKLCEQAGFKYLERHQRKLPSQSFWRIIYHQKHPEVEQILHEDILVFRKGEL